MCLSVPAKIISMEGSVATVDVAGNTREADLTMIEGARVGDYVLLHAGFAIGRYDREDALKTLAFWREIADAGASGDTARETPQGNEA